MKFTKFGSWNSVADWDMAPSKGLDLHHNAQGGSWIHAASHPVSTGDTFP